MRILFVEHQADKRIGGMERAATDISQSLQKLGIEVIRTSSISDSRKSCPDIVHFHGLWSIDHLIINDYFRKSRIPIVISPHGMLNNWSLSHNKIRKLVYFSLFEKQRLLKYSHVLATSRIEEEAINRRVGAKVATVIPLGIDTTIPLIDNLSAKHRVGCKEDEITLLFLGRIQPEKGLEEVLLALKQLPTWVAKEVNIHLIIIGQGQPEYISRLRRLSDSISDHTRIEWMGPIWDSRKWFYFAAADLFCFASYSENFGYSALEAAYMGTPILASVYTPWAEVDYKWLSIAIRPSVDSVKQGILDFISGFDRWRDTRVERHRWVVDNYSWETIGLQYEKFYTNILREE